MSALLKIIPPDDAFALDDGTLRLLQIIEATVDEVERLGAINELAQSRQRDAGRVLTETFERCMWRSTKLAIIRALGPMRLLRTTEFLIDLASNRDDLAFAAEAILALGSSDDPLAGEFLLSILGERDHPLHRETAIALSQLLVFPCEDELSAMFDRPESELSPALRQYLILALGRRGHSTAWGRIKPHLTADSTASQEAGGPVFNAAVVAAGMVGGKDALDTLHGLDTRYRFFVHHLKLLSTERIELRLRRSVEDAVTALLSAKEEPELQQALQFLREFPVAESWEAFKLLGHDLPPGTQVRVRVLLFDAERAADDLNYLIGHWGAVDWGWASGLVRLHEQQGAGAVDTLKKALPADALCALFMRLRSAQSFAVLAAIVTDEQQRIETRTKAVNAVVAQAKMTLRGSKTALEAAGLLLELFKSVESRELKGRIVRALGQVRHESDAFSMSLAAMLKDQSIDSASVYAALGRIGTDEAVRIILRRLSRVMNNSAHVQEIGQALSALAHIGKLPRGEDLPLVPEALWPTVLVPLLTLLASQGHQVYDSLILAGLAAPDFQTRILAIAAAKHAPRPLLQAQLFAALNDPSASLVGRAVDSLCVAADLAGHRQLVAWAGEPGRPQGLVLKVMRSLTPTAADYAVLVRDLDRLILRGTNAFTNAEVRAGATNLRDNLLLRRLDLGSVDMPSKKAAVAHSLDAALAECIDGYDQYNETVKTVLRNAELTFKHADLFDDRVDKSTVVVEFVKSIDLLLQEKVGAPIFLDQQSDLMSRMQSRVVHLQLDDDSVPAAQLVKDLQCGLHFSADAFPAHKLAGLARAIISGKILREQYATIDGLRAWALILLVFARRFKFRQSAVEPLLATKNPFNPFVCELAFDLNQLQELRNQAAHRATMLQSVKLVEIRSYSFKVLNDLKRALG